jgi:methionine-rich copper-binding protein CopC
MLIRSIALVSARFCLAAVVLLATFDIASAHAIITDSVPAVGATVAGPDIDVTLTYNSRIDLTRSRLQLVKPDNSKQDVAISPDSGPASLSGKVNGLTPGAYRLHWQVLSVDGHITRGDIPFTVKAD